LLHTGEPPTASPRTARGGATPPGTVRIYPYVAQPTEMRLEPEETARPIGPSAQERDFEILGKMLERKMKILKITPSEKQTQILQMRAVLDRNRTLLQQGSKEVHKDKPSPLLVRQLETALETTDALVKELDGVTDARTDEVLRPARRTHVLKRRSSLVPTGLSLRDTLPNSFT
jgi:hypothetical protein